MAGAGCLVAQGTDGGRVMESLLYSIIVALTAFAAIDVYFRDWRRRLISVVPVTIFAAFALGVVKWAFS